MTLTTASATRTYNETSDEWVPPSVSGSVWNDWGSSGADGTPPPAASGGGPNSNGQGEQGTQIPWYFRPYKFDRSSTAKGDLETWPNPYLPGAFSSTAIINESTTATSTVTGQATTTGAGTTVSSAFSTTNIFNDSANLSAQSPAGFSPSLQNAAGELQTGWAQLNEVDLSSGTNAGGLVNASFENIGSETTTYSFTSTTDTTPSPGEPLYLEMQSRSMSTSTSETGSYTTTAPGAPSVTPTLDNPAGYAKLNEERKDNNTVSNSATVSWVATSTGSGPSSETAWMTYNGSADSSYTSDMTVAVDASANTDAQSGSYTATGMKSDWSAIGRTGGSVGPVYGVNWTYGSTLASGRSITDSGTYPSGGLETLVSSGGRVWGETDPTFSTLAAIRRSVERGYPFGSESWSDRAVRRLGLESTLRPRGRPRKAAKSQNKASFRLLQR